MNTPTLLHLTKAGYELKDLLEYCDKASSKREYSSRLKGIITGLEHDHPMVAKFAMDMCDNMANMDDEFISPECFSVYVKTLVTMIYAMVRAFELANEEEPKPKGYMNERSDN